jgi:hypothetical protein
MSQPLRSPLLWAGLLTLTASFNGGNAGAVPLLAHHTPLQVTDATPSLVLQNDSYVDATSPAFLELGFLENEKAGVWVKVPASIPLFKADFFRVLLANPLGMAAGKDTDEVYFQMSLSPHGYIPEIPADITNSAVLTPGPIWNDIPTQDQSGRTLPCAKSGELVGAALTFTHSGAPSIFRDQSATNLQANTMFAIPGGWAYSGQYGFKGNWILRVVGHAASASECQ